MVFWLDWQTASPFNSPTTLGLSQFWSDRHGRSHATCHVGGSIQILVFMVAQQVFLPIEPSPSQELFLSACPRVK